MTFLSIMKQINRIKKTGEFQEILNKRKFRNTPAFTIYIQEKRDEKSRYGISVSKKMGNAVFRNKAKRQVRNMIEEISPYDKPFDGIVMVRKQFHINSYDTNKNELIKLLETVKI